MWRFLEPWIDVTGTIGFKCLQLNFELFEVDIQARNFPVLLYDHVVERLDRVILLGVEHLEPV
jgi:hypothetical protein